MSTMTLRDYLAQCRAAAPIEQARHLAMLPFASHVLDDELVFSTPEKYASACAAADAAERLAKDVAPSPNNR